MQRAGLAVALAVMTWSGLAEVASAQTPIMVIIESFTGREAGRFDLADLATTSAIPIGAAECDATIVFQFNNVDMARANLRFFEGANCNDPAVRTDMTTSSCNELAVPLTTIGMVTEVTVSARASDLVPCDAGGSGVRTIWVLALDDINSTVTDAGQQVSFPIAFNLAPPTGPAGFAAQGGESGARLTWTAASGVTEYEVFVDPNGCTDGTVTSELLADPENPDASASVATFTGPASSYTLTWPDSVPIGGEAAVAIRAADNAGNVGPLSTVLCVSRFNVTSWWEAYCAQTPTPESCSGGGGCSAMPARDAGAPWIFFAAGVALAIAWRRRSR